MFRRAVRVFVPFALVFLCVSCVSVGHSKFAGVTDLVRSPDYAAARELLEKQKEKLYQQNDKVLYALDTGMLAHYGGDYDSSNKSLADAEQLIFDYYAKSVSQAVGSAIINDTVTDYAGEDYEDIYANIFMALNYLHKNEPEEAFVEVRRFTNKLKGLSVKYRDQILAAKKESGVESSYASESIQFVDSAFARYLSLILFRSAGDLSSAQVDARFLTEAFKLQPRLYPFPVPSWLQDELTVPPGKARLNIIAFTGLAPYKVDETIRVPFRDAYLKISLPVMVKQHSQVVSVRARISDLPGFSLELLESMENVAEDTFNQKKDLVYFRSVARAAAKFVAGAAFAVAADHSDDDSGAAAMVFSLLNLGTRVFTEVTEQADTRVSHFFPARVHAGGVTLDPGTYAVSVDYADLNGKTLYTEHYGTVTVEENGPNVLESVYLK